MPVPAYRQGDPAWARDRVGGSGETLKKVGCVVTSVAMTFEYYGFETTPRTLNAYLKKNKGYDRRGWLNWYRAEGYTGGKLDLVYHGAPKRAVIDQHLALGRPVIVKTRSQRNSIHWVVIVGRTKRDYLVMDPLSRTGEPVPLKRIAKRLLAARVYARAG
jgi:uncharacterized protein YvpB